MSQFKNMSELGLESRSRRDSQFYEVGRGGSARIRSLDQCWLYVELILLFLQGTSSRSPWQRGKLLTTYNLANVCKELGPVPSPEIAVVTVTQ